MSQLIGKDPDVGRDWRPKEKGAAEDEMVGWHHWLSGHEFEQTPGDSEGQGRLECCSSWDHKESAQLSDWTTTLFLGSDVNPSYSWRREWLNSHQKDGGEVRELWFVWDKRFFFFWFILIGGWLLYNIVVVFAIHWHESAMGVHVLPILNPPPSPSPPTALALSVLFHASIWTGHVFPIW